MVSHPARSQKTLEAAVKRLLNTHNLNSIEFRTNGRDGISAFALPGYGHPLVEERRAKAIAALGGDISLSRMGPINEEAMRPVAHARAATFQEAIEGLKAALGTPAAR